MTRATARLTPKTTSSDRSAKGYYYGSGRKIAIIFDEDTFETISATAKQRRVSFASVVRELVEHGLIDAGIGDADRVKIERERCARIAERWNAPRIAQAIREEP